MLAIDFCILHQLSVKRTVNVTIIFGFDWLVFVMTAGRRTNHEDIFFSSHDHLTDFILPVEIQLPHVTWLSFSLLLLQILFMNKLDLFQEKILHSGRHLRFYLPQFKGGLAAYSVTISRNWALIKQLRFRLRMHQRLFTHEGWKLHEWKEKQRSGRRLTAPSFPRRRLWCGFCCALHGLRLRLAQRHPQQTHLPPLHHSHEHLQHPGGVPGGDGHHHQGEPGGRVAAVAVTNGSGMLGSLESRSWLEPGDVFVGHLGWNLTVSIDFYRIHFLERVNETCN